MQNSLVRLLPVLLVLLPFAAPTLAKGDTKPAPAPKSLETAGYGKWERLGMWGLSEDGKWLAYQVRRADGKTALHVRALGKDVGKPETFAYGSGQAFSKDGRWLAFRIGVSEKEREKLAKMKKPVPSKIALHDLAKGETENIEGISSFRFSDDGGFLLMRRSKPKGQKHGGSTALVRNLATGVTTSFGNVASAAWMDDAPLLAFVIDAADKLGNGIQLYDAKQGSLRTLASSEHKYTRLTWRKDAGDLAVLREREHKKDEDASFEIMTWKGLDTDRPTAAATYDHLKDKAFPEEMRVVDLGGLTWAESGKAVFFGIKKWKNKPKPKKEAKAAKGDKKDETKGDKKEQKKDEKKKAEAPKKEKPKKPAKPKTMRETLKDLSGVEVWHAKDVEVQPRQKKVYARKKNETVLCAWWIEPNSFVQLGGEKFERVRIAKPHRMAVGHDNGPYEAEKRFGPTLSDVYVVDGRTGAKLKVLERNKYHYGLGPQSRYLLYVKDKHLWTWDMDGGRHVNLTGKIETSFINQEISSLTDEKPPYGLAGWTEDGAHVFLYDKYDVWMFKSDGSAAKRLTQGAEKKIRYRREVLDREEDEFIRADRPMVLSMFGERTKASGYARMPVLGEGSVLPEQLLWKDARVGRLVKAKSADVFAYVEETFGDSPDIFVAGPSLADAKKATSTNAFQKDYAWSPRSVLIDYESDHGEPLQAALHYPAGYVEGKQYPMIVDIYEKRSSGLHRYSAPSERSPYNAGVFTTQGYFVLLPDIVYRPQNPGISAVECVVPAVKAALAKGGIDKRRIGLVGHSWGAYQTAFLVTQTDLFAAGVAGAPLTNMISMSMGNYWNSGRTNAWIFHESQGRMDKPFWRDVETYIKNSPIFHIEQMKTPLLIAFGDKDGAVDWHQGVEMYNAARLAQRPLVMLVYPGENHGLRQKPNQVDYHHRVREWFDHHLKGAKAKDWITKGKSHMERQEEIEALKKKNKKGGR